MAWYTPSKAKQMSFARTQTQTTQRGKRNFLDLLKNCCSSLHHASWLKSVIFQFNQSFTSFPFVSKLTLMAFFSLRAGRRLFTVKNLLLFTWRSYQVKKIEIINIYHSITFKQLFPPEKIWIFCYLVEICLPLIGGECLGYELSSTPQDMDQTSPELIIIIIDDNYHNGNNTLMNSDGMSERSPKKDCC